MGMFLYFLKQVQLRIIDFILNPGDREIENWEKVPEICFNINLIEIFL
jgi:hypothetical protein